ncbi:MAG: DUF2157 domain-containing protein [Candidatus Paceibacterota bacterium]
MDRDTLVAQLKRALDQGEITAQEVQSIVAPYKEDPEDKNLVLIRILSYIGGAIILMGVIVFVVMNWDQLGSLARVLLSLGVSVFAYILGVVGYMTTTLDRLKRRQSEFVANALLLIGVVLFPIGLAVLLHEAGMQVHTAGTQIVISAFSVILAIASYLLLQKLRLFLLVAIILGTWFLVAFINFTTDHGNAVPFDSFYLYQWLTIVIGTMYIAGGQWLVQRGEQSLSGALYAFGAIGILGAGLAGGDLWNLAYPLLLIGGFAGSVYLTSRSILVVSSLALIVYLIKITSEYFPDAVAAWPIALIALGGVIIAVSYGAYRLHQRMKTSSHTEADQFNSSQNLRL